MQHQTLPPSEIITQANVDLAYLRGLSASMPESGPQEPMQIQVAGGDERIELSVLRSASGVSPALFTALAKLDRDGDGYLTMSEIQAHLDSVNEGTIILDALDDPVMKKEMKKFDIDGDGNLKLREILMAFKLSQDRVDILKYSLAGLVLALMISYVVLGGLVYYVIQSTKESSIASSGTMLVKGTDQPVQVGSADFSVEGGVFHTKSACTNGTCAAPAPIQTLQALQPLKLSSALDDATLEQMRQMKLSSGVAFISFQVLAIARYIEPNSRYGSLVVVYTYVGELTLDGEAIFFHETLAGAFSRAGFVVDSSGRRLLGVIDVIGMFNHISNAAKEALSRNPAAEVPAQLPTEFAARVVFTEDCDDEAGRTTGMCDLASGPRVNWASKEPGHSSMVVRREEVQHSLRVNGRRVAKETATSPQWPGQSVTTIYNETHELVFQTYNGVNYFCTLRNDSALRSLPSPQADDGSRVDMVGYAEVAGVYCRHFRMTVPAGSGQQTIHLYEDYVRRQLRAIRFAEMQWLFLNLTAVPSEDRNPLAPQELDMDAVLRACDPPNIVPPARIIKGLLTARLDTDAYWGTPAPPPDAQGTNGSLLNFTGPSLQRRASPHITFRAGTPDHVERRSLSEPANASTDGDSMDLRSKKFKFGLKSFSASYEDSNGVMTLSLSASNWWWACPAVNGGLSFIIDKNRGIAQAEGSVTIKFKLDCGIASKFSKKLDSIMPTAELTIYAGFKPIVPAWDCNSFSFPSGTFTVGGWGKVSAGNRKLGLSMGLYGNAFIGLICDDNYQRRGRTSKTVRVGFQVLVYGDVTVSGQTASKAFYLEPTPDSTCSQALKGNGILPDGTGYKDSDGGMWNVVDTGHGTCY